MYSARMKTHTRNRREAGFTLYELLITVIIIGVVLSFGLSNLGDFTRNNRMTATANDLHAAFHLARSEASRGRTNVTICASADAMDFAPNCTGVGTWNQGYIVFADTNGDLLPNPGEPILRRHGPAEDGITLTFENNADYFSYAPSGLGRGDVGGLPAVSQVVMCDERGNIVGAGGNSAARLFVVTPMGRGTIVRDIPRIQTAINNLGAACP